MKNLFIVTTVPITLASILKGQPRFLNKHYKITLVTSDSNINESISSFEGVEIIQVPMEREISIINDFISLYSMIRLYYRFKPDLVHSYTPKAGLISMLASFICRVPIRVHTFTGLIFPTSTGIKRQILIWVDRLICACATTIVPEGNGVKLDLYNYKITKKDLQVIGSGNIAGVDIAKFDKSLVIRNELHKPLQIQLNLPDNAFVFCFVGRFTVDKGFIELIEAFQYLPEHAYLLLVGENDERLPLPDSVSNTINNHTRIHNVGWQEDIRPALAISNVLVLPSYREGFPNTPLQAGAMELPCIVTDINGCNEIITPKFNGWIVSVKDANALNSAMLQAMSCKQLDLMGSNAKAHIVKNFGRSEHWRNMLAFYKQLLAKTPIQ